jgi:hypothetical protein
VIQNFQVLWDNKPGVVILLVLGFFILVFLVVDTWRHKRARKDPDWKNH